jgi:hypothetical protein
MSLQIGEQRDPIHVKNKQNTAHKTEFFNIRQQTYNQAKLKLPLLNVMSILKLGG